LREEIAVPNYLPIRIESDLAGDVDCSAGTRHHYLCIAGWRREVGRIQELQVGGCRS
jgi:hypothetical protein